VSASLLNDKSAGESELADWVLPVAISAGIVVLLGLGFVVFKLGQRHAIATAAAKSAVADTEMTAANAVANEYGILPQSARSEPDYAGGNLDTIGVRNDADGDYAAGNLTTISAHD
jgi:hypothetical protein